MAARRHQDMLAFEDDPHAAGADAVEDAIVADQQSPKLATADAQSPEIP